MGGGSKLRLRVVARFAARLHGNETHVDVTVLAGPDWDHLILCGTLTLSEAQWATLGTALKKGMGDDVQLEDVAVPHPT